MTKVSGSLATPSPDRSAGVVGDCVSWVMSSSRNGVLLPAQPVVELPFLELLADVVGRNVLGPRQPPDLAGNEDGAHGASPSVVVPALSAARVLLRRSEAIVYWGHVMRPATLSRGRQTPPKRTRSPYAIHQTRS